MNSPDVLRKTQHLCCWDYFRNGKNSTQQDIFRLNVLNSHTKTPLTTTHAEKYKIKMEKKPVKGPISKNYF